MKVIKIIFHPITKTIKYFQVLFLVLDSINDKLEQIKIMLETIEKSNKDISLCIRTDSNRQKYIATNPYTN
jgi:hypothetical protein